MGDANCVDAANSLKKRRYSVEVGVDGPVAVEPVNPCHLKCHPSFSHDIV